MKKIILFLVASALVIGCSKKENTELGYVVQVTSGDWNHSSYSTEQIIDRLEAVSSQVKVDKVIIGWSLDKEMYLKIGEYLHSKNIQMLFWLPVFAETEDVCDNVPAVDLWGNVPGSYEAAFKFNCPSNPQNIDNVISLFEKELADCHFDGVFLDRIRTQSFVSGVEGVLNCGCEICAERFKACGVDLAEVRKAFEEKGDKFLSVTGYDIKNGFTFEDPLAAEFFKVKGQLVSESVCRVADYFRNKKMIVGMDLYAPLMAQFVGQDYEILAQHTDFIKPMLYRQTYAPAGIGFEYELLLKSIPDAEGYPSMEMDVDFLKGQLKAMSDLPCDKYPGIEINYSRKAAPTTPEYIVESMQAIKEFGFSGAVLSWNIMQAPDEHVKCLCNF